MIIKSLKLDNIRSYTSQEIKFPTGSTLLCGDIGSGKSSILLAIEFALFGIRRAQLTPASLLRHGKKEGGVELHFEVEGREVIIKRNLKKSADAIKQESGFVIVDGKKIDGTAVELKTIILDLLGYPKELVTKSKSLIYRYTVYTPQEEMKYILFEEKEQRLDTLRKVFGIDKYKRISENAAVYIKHLKEENKELNGRIADLNEKKKTMHEQKEKIAEVENNLKKLLPGIKAVKSELENKKKEIEHIEQKVKQLNELKNKYSILETRLKDKVELNNKIKNDLKSLEEQNTKLKQKIDSIVVKDITEKPEELEKEIAQEQEKISKIIEDRTKLKERANSLKTIIKKLKAEVEEHTEQIKALSIKKSELEALDNEISKKPQIMKDINSAEEKLKSLHMKLKGLEVKNELSERTKYNINKLALCPTCRQPVSEDHKKHVCEKEDSRIAENRQSITSMEQDKRNLSQNIENAKKLFDKLAEKEKLGEKLKAEIANLEVLKKRLVEKQKEYSKNDIELINISGRLEKIEELDVEKLKKEVQEKGLLLKKIQEKRHLMQMLDEKIKARNDLEETVRELKTQIGKINTEKMELNDKINELKDIENSYLKAKHQIEKISADERKAEIDKAAFDQELKSVKKIIELIEKEINEKQAVKEKLDVLGQIQHWFDKYFVNLAAVMEKHVMLKVYHEFNDLFKKWFSMLLEDDAISVRLDECFTPIVEQNGYEVEIENLSGGEKTSLALAYRLALNKVINDVMSSIKTKELIILDEPTDGFSTEQLDKLKDVLDELNIEQTILVSHEAKIEGFVENLIRVNKHEHVSAVE